MTTHTIIPSEELAEAVANELLAHGEFSSMPATSRRNALIAAKAVIEIVTSRAVPAVGEASPAKAALHTYKVASRNARCPICNGIEGCDHTVRERLLADLNPLPSTEGK